MTPDYFSREDLEKDLKFYDQWRHKAEKVIGELERNEESI